MSTLLQKKKEEKKQNLIESALELFLNKGINKTSIDEIVNKAKVAKGTFYLYFKDKTDVMQEIVCKLSRQVLSEGQAYVVAHDAGDFVENVVLLIDYIIEYFKKNKMLLRLLERNFSWPVLRNKLQSGESDDVLDELLLTCMTSPYLIRYSEEQIYQMIYIIIEMVGSICYSSIINEQPSDVDTLKPMLYTIIRKILK